MLYLTHHFIITTLALLMALPGTAQQANDKDALFDGTYNKAYIRKHRVHTITTVSTMGGRQIGRQIHYFDKAGLLQYIHVQDTTGQTISTYYFGYDQHQNRVMQVRCQSGCDTIRFERTYQGILLISESLGYLPVIVYHQYNDKGQRTASVRSHYDAGNKPAKQKQQFEYDEHGLMVHATESIVTAETDSTLQWLSDRRMTYSNGRLAAVQESIPAFYISTNRGNQRFEYDKKGNLLSAISDARVSRFYRYNKKKLLIYSKEVTPADDELLSFRPTETTYSYSFW